MLVASIGPLLLFQINNTSSVDFREHFDSSCGVVWTVCM